MSAMLPEQSGWGEFGPAESSILANERQRRILSILQEQSVPMTARDLALELAVAEQDGPRTDISEADRRKIHLQLHHNLLPKLESVGWIRRYPNGSFALDQFSTESFDELMDALEHPDALTQDALESILARPHRQAVLSAVADRDDPLTVSALVSELPAEECDSITSGATAGMDCPEIALHHIDLPELDTLGLVAYDAEARTVAPTPSLETLF